MVDKISVQIALEGGDEVEKQLAAIGKAGDKAFAGLNEAGSTAAEGINKTGEAAGKAAESTSKLTLANVALVAAIAESTSGVAEHAVGIVQAVRHHETLFQTLLKLVSGANNATKALALMAPELTVVGAGVLAIAGPVASAVVAFEALEKVVTKVAAGAEKLNHSLQTLAATSGVSFENLQRGEAVFGQIGIKAETFRGSIAKIQKTLEDVEVTNLTRGMKDIVALVQQIAAGDKTITFANWVTAEDKIKGVAIAMKQAADSGKDATTVLLEFIRNADLATAIKIGAAFGLSEADVDRVRRLNENVGDLYQRVQGAPPLISPENAAIFDRMRTSIQNLASARARLAQAFSSMDFQAMAASFSATMHEMEAAATNAAAAIVERMGTAFRGMMSQASSDVAAIGAALLDLAQRIGAVDWFRQMQADAQTANAAVATFFGNIMQQAGFSAASIKAVQDSINGIAPAANTAGQAVQQTGVQFTSFGTVAQGAANTAKAAVQEGVQIWTQWGTAATQAGDAAVQAGQKGQTAGQQAKSGADMALEGWLKLLDILKQYLGLAPKAGAPVAGGAPVGGPGGGIGSNARGGLLGGRGTGTSDSNLAWVSRGEHIMPAHVVRQPGVLGLLETLRRGGGIPGFAAGGQVGDIPSKLDEITKSFVQAFDAIDAANKSNLRTMDNILRSIAEAALSMDQGMRGVQDIMRPAIQALQDLIRAPGRRGGGLLGGRGTGTSDSNLAWVSRGEYVTPARAVAQPGVLAFLEALRRSGGNLRGVLDGMGRFALGGMVSRMPAFAGGGSVGGMNHVTIAFPGLPAISGLRASADVVDQLQRAAALAQVRSGGRKPSRYS